MQYIYSEECKSCGAPSNGMTICPWCGSPIPFKQIPEQNTLGHNADNGQLSYDETQSDFSRSFEKLTGFKF